MQTKYKSSLLLTYGLGKDERMFIINCDPCDSTYLLSDSVVESRHSTSKGMIGYVKCPEGHRMVDVLPDGYPKPPPPAVVLARRAAGGAG